MLRFIDLTGQVFLDDTFCFAWFCTVTDTFLTLDGTQMWMDWQEFEEDWNEEKEEGKYELERFVGLFPKDKEGYRYWIKEGRVEMRALRVRIEDEEYEELRQCISHHGEISFILRRAVKEFIKEKRDDKTNLRTKRK